MIRTLVAIVATEVRMAARQRLSAALLFVLPLLTMPGTLRGGELYLETIEHAAGNAGDGAAPAALPVAVVGSDEVAGWLAASPGLKVVDGDAVPARGPLGPEDLHAVATVDKRHIVVSYRSDLPKSGRAADRIEAAVKEGVESKREGRLAEQGLPQTPEAVLTLTVVDHPSAGGSRLGGILPLLIQFTLVMVALYTALDVISGEKERKTGESLLTTAVDRRLIAAAKWLVVASAATIAGLVGVGGVVVLAALGALDLPLVLGETGDALLTAPALAVVGLTTILLALQTSAAAVVLAAWVPDYRTGSMASAPAALFLIAPAAVALAPGVEGSPALWVLPIANLALACRGLLDGTLPALGGVLVLASSTLHAALAVGVAASLLGREASLIGSGDARARRALGDTRREAFFLFASCLLLFWFFGQLAQASDLIGGLVFTQVGLIALPALGVVGWLGLPLRETLSLRTPRPRDLGLAVLAGAGLVGVGQTVWRLQDPFIPTPTAVLDAFGVLALVDQPLWVPLVIFALLPALCEELLFRGALLGMLASTVRPAGRVVGVALAFGVLHLLLPRILSTAALGVVLGFAVLRSRSLWVAVVMHAMNNGILVTLARAPAYEAFLDSNVFLGAAALVSGAAVWAMRGPDVTPTVGDGGPRTSVQSP